jgi:hypothetical protein
VTNFHFGIVELETASDVNKSTLLKYLVSQKALETMGEFRFGLETDLSV